ncbi:MAG: hypothetical protein JNK38_18425 [Acidobacteria bacterium]|nr:hypothetical protein [Acidobacteriota bacterium]
MTSLFAASDFGLLRLTSVVANESQLANFQSHVRGDHWDQQANRGSRLRPETTSSPEQGIVPLTSGVPQTGTVPAAQPGGGVLSGTQYTIQVPSGATQLQITLSGNQDVDLLARFGQPVTISNGQPVADHVSATISSGNESITVTPASSPPLRAGIYYIGIANFSTSVASFTLTATVSGGTPTDTVEMFVDDGSFEDAIGLTQGGTATAVNRITPPAYPATLTAVRISFRNAAGVNVGSSFTIQVGANTDGDSEINGIPLQATSATVQSLDQFVTYTVPSVTINSGDFVVGFRYTSTTGVRPFSLDATPPSRQRSYVSMGGSFAVIDGLGFPGNFGIRAVATVPQQCTYSISATSQFFNASGGPGSVSVNAQPGCSWTATSNASFITVTSGSSGSGNGSVVFSVAANQSQVQRVGTMTIAGQTFTVTQAPGAPNTVPLVSGVPQTGSVANAQPGFCLLSETQYTIQVPAGATQLGVTLVSNQDVDLYLRFGQPLTIANGEILHDHKATTGGNTESLIITPAGSPPLQAGTYFIGVNNCGTGSASFTLTATVATQPQCSYSITPTSQLVNATGGLGNINLMTANGCPWTAVSNASWITITSGASGSGPGLIGFTVAANSAAGDRTGTITVAGQTFTVTQSGQVQTARTLRVVSADGVQGGFVSLPIELVSLGDENSFAFSLNFNPAVLSNPQATLGDGVPNSTALLVNDSQKAQGRFGASLQLPVNQTMATGTRRVLTVRFEVASNPNLTTTEISFGDQPIRRVVGNAQANELPSNYASGTVTILPGWEADVHPRPTGSNDGTVSPLDAAQVGRFAAGLDTPNNGNEFQRADCSPRASKGDGILNGLDWAQASRFAANLDPVATADGPRNPNALLPEPVVAEQSDSSASPEQQRVIRVVNANAQPGGQVGVVVNMTALGNENVFSFSLNFDPTVLSNPMVATSNALPAGSQLTVNDTQKTQGRIGVLLLLPPGQAIAAGSRDLILVTFTVAANTTVASTPITFGNQPIARLVGDKDLNDITAATTFTNGAVTITGQNNPVPSVSSISPNSATAGGAGFTLTVNGSNFVSGATVHWNGSPRSTTFVSAAQLTAIISAADITSAGTANITVVNPAPGGGTSNAVQFIINPQQTTTRTLRVGQASGSPGSTVTVPIELVAQGDENALGFSLNFDPAVLNNPQVMTGSDAANASLNVNSSQLGQGRVGVLLALPAGQAFPSGVRQVVKVTFTIGTGVTVTTTQLGFGDQPIAREISSVNASILPVNYVGGALTITQGYEADVAPRPNGNNNGTVTVTDWVQVGRFVAGLDTAAVGSEFQRADVAPKESLGDGRLSVSDLTQAGRYAAGLDAVVAAGGSTSPVSGLAANETTPPAEIEQVTRNVRIVEARVERGQSGVVAVAFEAQGGENAFGFSLNFDSSQLRFVSATLGKDAVNATLAVNANQIANGRVGIVLALPGGQSFAVGIRELVTLNFMAVAEGNPEMTALGFSDLPVARELADVNARVLPVNFTGASVKITRTAASVSAASFVGTELASESITAAFGSKLATTIQIADRLPLPTELAGTTIKVKDSAGVERLAPLFFVAPTQINYLIPAGMASGKATMTITSGDGVVSNGETMIQAVAPGLFSANASGQGIAAATVLRVKADGSQSFEPVSRFDPAQSKVVPVPIDLGPETDQVFLLLFGTGGRGRSSLANVQADIGGLAAETLYAGPQGDFAGLDQFNLRLPRSMAGRGEVQIRLVVDGKAANIVTVTVK